MGTPLDKLNMQTLSVKSLNSFEGIITHFHNGNSIMQIEELIDTFYVNQKRDRFYVINLRSTINYVDEVKLYLLYD